MNKELHFEILPVEQQRLLKLLSGESFLKDWYLAGGTCLALYLGHRQSFDFDFFFPQILTHRLLLTYSPG